MCYLPILVTWICIFMSTHIKIDDLKTKFEKTKGKETVTYQEGITYFEKLAQKYDQIHMRAYGVTDIGKPLCSSTIYR